MSFAITSTSNGDFEEMRTSTEISTFSLRLSSTIELPCLDKEPGPLHSILQDDSGNLYYSDEINHSLVSLNGAGELRWHKSRQGKNAGEFRYPKGIELGWVGANGANERCLAVCDSWNRRVQFFDRDGSFLTSWDKVGEESLKDVVDIRYIGAADGSKPELSYWLILDRGHHSLFGVDISGELIFQIGRAFPDNLESHWLLPSYSTQLQVSPFDLIRNSLPYDPLFMPARIFGSTEKALFVWEPKSNRLKHTALGNMLPLWIDPPNGAEWVGADEHGLLCFSRDAGSLASYDGNTKTWQLAKIQGTPVPSGRSTKEVWSQDGSSLRHWICSIGRDNARSWMLFGLPDEIAAAMQLELVPADREQLQAAAAHLRDLSKKALKAFADLSCDSANVQGARNSLACSMQALTAALSRMGIMWRAAFLGLLKIHTLQSLHPAAEDRQYFRQLLRSVNAAVKPMASLFEEMLLFRDEWLMTQLEKAASGDADSTQIGEQLLQEYSDSLMKVIIESAKLLWPLLLSEMLEQLPIIYPEQSNWGRFRRSLQHPSFPRAEESRHFREVDRICLGSPAGASPASPAVIQYAPGLGFLVSLNASGRVLRLSEQGRVLGFLSLPCKSDMVFQNPYGVEVDSAGRIWISQPQKNRIEIMDINADCIRVLGELSGVVPNMKFPTGILRTSRGEMLIADTHHNRIVAVSDDGHVTTLGHGNGRKPVELKHPMAFCRTQHEDQFWVVDLRNHCVRLLDLDGHLISTIGGPGLGKGCLVLPESATVFDDGMLAVSQWACNQVIKIFSQEGNELETFQLDYPPWGILAHRSLLLVCEKNGNHVRVYERI